MPKIVDHEQYRKELLGKCFDLFAQKGYGSITMREIAQGLRVSTGTLYHYFPSKESLFEHLVEEICEQDLSAALGELGGRKTIPEAMAALGRYLAKNEDYFIKWTYIWVNFCQHQDSKQQGKRVFQRANERYRKTAEEVLGIQDPVLVSFVLSCIDGLLLGKLQGNETINFPEQCALLGKMLTAYLQRQESEQLKIRN